MFSDITLENYEEKRRELVAANSNLVGVVLREKELRLDEYLTALKKEYAETCSGRIAYDIPVLTDKTLPSSKLYRFCSQLPKGADLHVHDMSLLPVPELIPLLTSCPEFCINADRASYDLIVVDPKETVPTGYLRFYEAMQSGFYTVDELVQHWTVAGSEASGLGIWEYFETLFERHAALSSNPAFAAKYYDYTFRYYCRKLE